ncbi:uncharacterized protein PHACADRAFT_251677 [Phanerochaete carnosa HHB-10118-sp]|uniref:Fungal N-terminal domain-containing protein n=1 Tax=Phanerochaete carnosa (strain HHB-10118-sp) TaxID=650164 RepID=K5WFI9_PHACS|nr:uncharacterized protein PHACADRAFT_251677 [Phanerochaete carnosa HHB-10118-sp]EKM57814.1 hypothetical protein PHACADRAFT_251677 [Phanerochaete carnosa HHB-10118-sp]
MDPINAIATTLGALSQVIYCIWSCSSSYKINREEVKAFTRHAEDMINFLEEAERKIGGGRSLPDDAMLRISKFIKSVTHSPSLGHSY